MFTIKVLSLSNLPLLLTVADDLFDNPIDEKLTAEFLADPRHHIVAAIDNDIIIGFASALHYIHPDKPPELWINEVGVAPSHQKQGIGKALMKEMLRLGQKLGCKTAWVLTEKDNIPANGLYKSAGRLMKGTRLCMSLCWIENKCLCHFDERSEEKSAPRR